MSKRKTPPARMMFVAEEGTVALYIEFDGKRIAKRYSGERWISLEPGYTVRGSEPGSDPNSLTVEYNPEATGVQ